MKSVSRLLVIAATLAIALSSLFVSPVAAWDSSCDPGQICIWRDRDFGGPVAAQTGSVTLYSGNYPGYPVALNDSASSVWNRYSTVDVVMYNEASFTGAQFCVDSGASYYWVGLLNNDAWSSHDVKGSDTWC